MIREELSWQVGRMFYGEDDQDIYFPPYHEKGIESNNSVLTI